MTSQMDVLYLKDLGHVLAAFTRVSEPDQIETSALGFVGDGLHLRGLGDPKNYKPPADFNTQDFVVPPGQVALARVDLNPSQLAAPRDQYVTISNTPPTLKSFPNSPPTITPGTTPPSLTINSISNVFPSETNFLILIEGPALGSPIEQPSSLPPNQASVKVNLPATLSPGPYYAIVFIPTYPIAVQHFSI